MKNNLLEIRSYRSNKLTIFPALSPTLGTASHHQSSECVPPAKRQRWSFPQTLAPPSAIFSSKVHSSAYRTSTTVLNFDRGFKWKFSSIVMSAGLPSMVLMSLGLSSNECRILKSGAINN